MVSLLAGGIRQLLAFPRLFGSAGSFLFPQTFQKQLVNFCPGLRGILIEAVLTAGCGEKRHLDHPNSSSQDGTSRSRSLPTATSCGSQRTELTRLPSDGSPGRGLFGAAV